MRLYDKTFKHQNREAKIIALTSLLFGGLFYGFGNSRLFPMPVLFQAAGLSLIVYSVFVATAYLLKEYRVSLEKNDKKEGEIKELYDLIVYERKGKREPKVCHIGLNTIKSVKIVTKESLKASKKEKLDGFRYIYDNRFLWKERIEIVAKTGDYTSVIYLSVDPSLLQLLIENT